MPGVAQSVWGTRVGSGCYRNRNRNRERRRPMPFGHGKLEVYSALDCTAIPDVPPVCEAQPGSWLRLCRDNATGAQSVRYCLLPTRRCLGVGRVDARRPDTQANEQKAPLESDCEPTDAARTAWLRDSRGAWGMPGQSARSRLALAGDTQVHELFDLFLHRYPKAGRSPRALGPLPIKRGRTQGPQRHHHSPSPPGLPSVAPE